MCCCRCQDPPQRARPPPRPPASPRKVPKAPRDSFVLLALKRIHLRNTFGRVTRIGGSALPGARRRPAGSKPSAPSPVVVRSAHSLGQNRPITPVLMAQGTTGSRLRLGCGEYFFVVEQRLAYLKPALD